MDHYCEVRVLPDPEFSEEMLMAALFAKLHRALVTKGGGDTGVSFPRAGIKPGAILRIHGSADSLNALEAMHWRKGLNDYCRCSAILPVPESVAWRTVSRVQVKSNALRLMRRSVNKGWLTEEEATQRLANITEQRTELPFLNIKSASTGQVFRLFIQHGELQSSPVEGTFSSYGLSPVATIPWF